MTVVLTDKVSPKIDERFTLKSFTEGEFSTDYEWVDAATIKINSVNTAALTNYKRTGDDRYTTKEVANTQQVLTLSQDVGFRAILDKLDQKHTSGALAVGRFMRKQTEEEYIPTLDKFRLQYLATTASTNGNLITQAITKDNVYEKFLEMNEKMTDEKVPTVNRTAWMTAKAYNMFKLGGFVTDSDAGFKAKQMGDVGMIDGVKIKIVPRSYLPTNHEIILAYKGSWLAPKVLADLIDHGETPQASGNTVTGRLAHDCFVLNMKKKGIAALKTAQKGHIMAKSVDIHDYDPIEEAKKGLFRAF